MGAAESRITIYKREWRRRQQLEIFRSQGLEPEDVNDVSKTSDVTCIVCGKTTRRFSTIRRHRHYEECPYND